MLLDTHGGPMSRLGWSMDREIAWLLDATSGPDWQSRGRGFCMNSAPPRVAPPAQIELPLPLFLSLVQVCPLLQMLEAQPVVEGFKILLSAVLALLNRIGVGLLGGLSLCLELDL